MKLIPGKPPKKEYELIPAEFYGARIFHAVDKGSQPNQFKNGSLQRKIEVGWELDAYMKDGRPFAMYKTYTASFDDRSNLYADLKLIFGEDPVTIELKDLLKKLIGMECGMVIGHKKKEDGTLKPEIQSMMSGKMAGRKGPDKNRNTPVVFSLDEWDEEVFNGLKDFTKDAIKASPEYQELMTPAKTDDDPDGDMPF